MKKRYQVFISSTYEDLRMERSKVMTALLELNCIPAGMELFPAADDSAWKLICDVIDECDYYVLILAGRYGSTDESGMSYTEKEYRYAVQQKKPIIAFLHSSSGEIASNKCESSTEGRQKLEEFRKLAQQKLCKYWRNGDELDSVVSRSLVQLINRTPGIGWVRADQLPAEDVLTETIRLQKRVGELEGQLKELSAGPPPGTDVLAQGSDEVRLDFDVRGMNEAMNEEKVKSREIPTTWIEVLNVIARVLILSPAESEVGKTLAEFYQRQMDLTDFGSNLNGVYPSDDTLEKLRIQFRALGIVTQHRETRESNSPLYRSGYSFFRWHLTEYGDRLITQMLAVRKSPKDLSQEIRPIDQQK